MRDNKPFRGFTLVFICTLGALAFLCLRCTRISSDRSEQIVAKVNAEPIYTKDFMLNYNQLKASQDEISQKNPKLRKQLKTRALNEAIIITILNQEAAKARIRIAKEEVDGRLANWKDGYPPGGFEEMLRKRNTTEAYLKRRIREQLLIEKLAAELFSSETLVSGEELKAYYKKHRDEFFRAAKVHAYQIVVPTKQEAEKIRKEILSKKLTFQSAARQYSLSPDAARGGDLGFYSKNEKIPAFNKAFALPVGAISKPIQSRYGVHLVKVVEKQRSKKLKFGEAKTDVVKKIKRLKEARIYKEWVTNLLKEAKIHRNETLFASIE